MLDTLLILIKPGVCRLSQGTHPSSPCKRSSVPRACRPRPARLHQIGPSAVIRIWNGMAYWPSCAPSPPDLLLMFNVPRW